MRVCVFFSPVCPRIGEQNEMGKKRETTQLMKQTKVENRETKKNPNTITIIECEINVYETKSVSIHSQEVNCIDMKN